MDLTLANLLNALPLSVYLIDKAGTVSYENGHAIQAFGSYLGQTALSYQPGGISDLVRNTIAEMSFTTRSSAFARVIDPTGSRIQWNYMSSK